MTHYQQAEAAWLKEPKPRKRALQKSIENLQTVDGALANLMLSHLKQKFIINYIRTRELEEANERSHGTGDSSTAKA